MKKYLVVVILLFLTMFFNSCSQGEHPPGHKHEANADENMVSGYLKDGVRIVELVASRYKFEPDPIVVRHMDKVRLIATSSDVTHGIAIPGFRVELTIPAGKKSETEFVADKRGTFHTQCSVYCGPGHGHMHGTLIVK